MPRWSCPARRPGWGPRGQPTHGRCVNEDQIRHHIAYKRDGERTLPAEVAQRMLDALDAGAEPDYQKLLAEAHAAQLDGLACKGQVNRQQHDTIQHHQLIADRSADLCSSKQLPTQPG